MADVVSMPKLGFDMAEGTLVRWVASEGSPIDKGAVLAEIETDKATVEVESTYSGVIGLHLVKEGAIVPVNTPIAVIVQPGEAVDLKALGLEQAEATATLPAEKISPTPQDVHPVVTPVEEAVVEDTQLPGGVRASPLARTGYRSGG